MGVRTADNDCGGVAMSECIQCHGTGYMTVRDRSADPSVTQSDQGAGRIEPCTHCRVGSARWWERKQKQADERPNGANWSKSTSLEEGEQSE